MSRMVVAAALLTTPDGRVLITQRRADQALALKWELPGGKIEPGESPEQALARELGEEIGVCVYIGKIWDVLHHIYATHEVLMLVYGCGLVAGQSPKCLEVNDLVWCTPDELGAYDILAADRPLVLRLRAEGVPAPPSGRELAQEY